MATRIRFRLLALFLLAAAIAAGQGTNIIPAPRILVGTGAPSTGCTVAASVGKVYIQRNLAATTSPLFICSNTGAGTFAWVSSGGGGGGGGATIPSVTNLIKGDGAGNGADTKVAITSPMTAATIAFSGDNETVTLPNGTLLANGGPLGTPSSGNGSNLTNLAVGNCAGCAPLASPTFTGTVTVPNGGVFNTPTSVTLTNATGLPISTGLTGAGTGVLTALGINVSGSGGMCLITSCTMVTPVIGVATGTSLTVTGSITSGSGSGVGGALDIAQGTLPSIVANTFSMVAPTSLTGYEEVVPSAAGSGIKTYSNAANVVTQAFLAGTTTTLLHGNASGAPTYAAVSLTADVTGLLPAANLINSGVFTGDVTTTFPAVTVARVNGITYSATAAAHSVEVITTANTTATAKVLPDCTDTGGNHLNYTQSSDAFSCGTSGAAAGITIGTTTITSGTTNRVLFDNAGVVGEIATANNAVFVTSGAGVPSIAAPSANLQVSSSVLDTIQGIQTTSTPRFARLGLGQAADATAPIAMTMAPAANTLVDGLILQNTTAATSGNQQYSPSIHLIGQGWKNNTTVSQTVEWIATAVPVQGTVSADGYLTLTEKVNGSTYAAIKIGSVPTFANTTSIYDGNLTPSSTNYAMELDGGGGTELNGANVLTLRQGGTTWLSLGSSGTVGTIPNASILKFGATAVSEQTAGQLDIATTNCGTAANCRDIRLRGLVSGGSQPSTSGCGTTGSPAGGNMSGTFTSGAISCTIVLTLSTAPTGWNCWLVDRSTGTGSPIVNTSSSTTTATFPTVTTVMGDTMAFGCHEY